MLSSSACSLFPVSRNDGWGGHDDMQGPLELLLPHQQLQHNLWGLNVYLPQIVDDIGCGFLVPSSEGHHYD